MTKISNRNLLVVAKELLDEESLELELRMLNDLLPKVELLKKVANATEIFDLDRCRHYKQTEAVTKRIQEKKFTAFVFLCSKN
jgi:hypothetical protein